MQRNTILFIAVKNLHFSGAFSAHHQELKNSIYRIWYLLSLVTATASVVEMELLAWMRWNCIHTRSSSNEA